MACAFVNGHIYVGSRYVPQIEGLWDINKDYENFSIVIDENNNSFTSKQNVPAGIELSNNEYWVQTGNFNASFQQQIITLQNEIQDLKNRVTILEG